MWIVVSESFNKYWLICLLIIGLHASITCSYGDDETNMVDSSADNTTKITFDSLAESIHVHRRAKRAANDSTSK